MVAFECFVLFPKELKLYCQIRTVGEREKSLERWNAGAPSVFSLSATNFHEATINSLMRTRVLWIPRGICRLWDSFWMRENYCPLVPSETSPSASKLTGRKFFDTYIYIYISISFIIHGIVYVHLFWISNMYKWFLLGTSMLSHQITIIISNSALCH